MSSCSLARLASLLASLLVGRDGSAIGVGSVCDYGGRADVVRMSCDGGCLLLGSLTLRLCPSPRFLDTVGGEGSWFRRRWLSSDFCRLPSSLACGADGAGLLACSYGCRSFPSCDVRVRGFCGSRSLRLPGLLRHGILMSCRSGRMSAIAVHRNSLACFSIPIAAPLFTSSPSSTPYSGHGRSFNPFITPDCSWGRSFRRAAPRSLYPWRTGRSVFLCLLSLRRAN